MKKSLSLILLLLMSLTLQAEIKLPSVIADGMVLQQKQAIPVWGWADAGTEVTVSFKGQTKSAKADANGKWMLKLDAVDASAEPAEMTVKVGSETKVLKDVLVGEVWLCGGQSNMEFQLSWLSGKARESQYEPLAEYIRNEIKTANDPLLRQIKVPKKVSAFEELTNFKGAWVKAVPGKIQDFTGTGYFFARELRKKLNVPVGLLNCNWGGTLVEPWIPMSKFQTTDSLKKYYESQVSSVKQRLEKWDPAKAKANYEKQLAAWKEKVKKAKEAGKNAPRKPRMQQKPDASNRIPSTLYNAMTHTLVPYAIKGAIWYQGESNSGHFADDYKEHFGAMIEAWREVWGQGDFQFYWCQLAQFKGANDQPLGKDGWVTVCDQQRLTLSLPNTGMAVLNDIGEAKDIHPKNKMDAGKRLSLWALKQAYAKDLVHSGPLYKSSKIEGNKVIVTFDSVGSGLMVGKKTLQEPTVEVSEPLKRFQICGADNKWVWAEAKITGKDTVEVWHKDVAAPVEVRYAWSPNALGANLYNKEGLPASLFKTK